jgi:hypothetical protein
VHEGALRGERRDGGLGFGLHEEVDLRRIGPDEELAEKVEDEETRAAVPAVRREGSEVDEDPQAPPL